jgi:hypothetical protein
MPVLEQVQFPVYAVPAPGSFSHVSVSEHTGKQSNDIFKQDMFMQMKQIISSPKYSHKSKSNYWESPTGALHGEGSSFGHPGNESFNGTFEGHSELETPKTWYGDRLVTKVEKMEAMNMQQERKLMYVADARCHVEQGVPTGT